MSASTITFIDDPTGRTENVPGSRLRAPWADVEAYDALMANWKRIADTSLDEVEEHCADHLFDLLIPEDVAEAHWSPVRHATEVHDTTRLEEIIRLLAAEILAAVESFDQGGSIMLSPAGTLLIAEAAFRANPIAVLDQVIEEEARSRYKCKHSGERGNPLTREKEKTSPEWEYDRYKRRDRPCHELLRQWCGHRVIKFHE